MVSLDSLHKRFYLSRSFLQPTAPQSWSGHHHHFHISGSITSTHFPVITDCRWELSTPMAPTQLEAPLPSCPVTLAAWPVGTASPQATPPLRPHRQCLIRTRLGWQSPVPRGPRTSHNVAAGASWAWLREGHCFPPPIPHGPCPVAVDVNVWLHLTL